MKFTNNERHLLGMIKSLSARISELETGKQTTKLGYVCICCHTTQPSNHYWYEAVNKDSAKDILFPICAKCIRGDGLSKLPEKYSKSDGPYNQPVPK